MFLVLLFAYLTLASSQQADDDWIDPYDMLNSGATAKTVRESTEPAKHSNVQIPPRDDVGDSGQAGMTIYNEQLAVQQTQIKAQEKKMKHILQQPTCNPVFKRFLRRLLRDIHRLGLPSDSADVYYDAQIRLSKQSVSEIQMFLDGGEDSWRPGALDNAVSQILVDLRQHDYEAWRWRFEDTFGVELDTLLKLSLAVLSMVAIVGTQLWSSISCFVQCRRFFVICFLVSVVWNWFYLYKTAFAEHQRNIAKMDSVNDKCTGVKMITWSDSLKEWFRSTWTLQDDPCKKYYEVLMVDPILLVPPSKAISVTVTTFFTEPLKHIGQGISEFLRALLKDLPISLQIPVLFIIVLAIVVLMYVSVQASFRYGIWAPFRHPNPPPLPEPNQPHLQAVEGRVEGGDAQQCIPQRNADEAGLQRNRVCLPRPSREPALKVVETLRSANASTHRAYQLDGNRRKRAEEGQGDESDPQTEPDLDNLAQEVRRPAKTNHITSECDSFRSEPPKDDSSMERVSPMHKCTPDNNKDAVEVRKTSSAGGGAASSATLTDVETVGTPVQQSMSSNIS